MSDFYSLLTRTIEQLKHDPNQSRQVIYDAVRLELRRQATLQRPYLSNAEILQRMLELEQAIAWVEAEATGKQIEGPPREAGAEVPRDAAPDEAPAQATPGEQHESPPAPESDEPQRSSESGRDLVVAHGGYGPMPQSAIGIFDPTLQAGPGWGLRPYDAPPPPKRPSFGRRIVSSLALLAQLTIASAAGVTIYALLSGRGVLPGPPVPPPVSKTAQASAQPAKVESAPVIAAPAAPSFSLPTMFGVYAIHAGRTIELEQAATGPVDPRTPNLLQITKPPKTTLPDGRLTFLVFHRDVMVSAPDRVPVRIAARISKMMNFDVNGKVVTAAPPTDTWFIRDVGYDLRVLPVRDRQEMILLRPADSDFAFPPGRYELLLNSQPYDFAVDGPVTDPAHCVEGSATTRGPVFYECRPEARVAPRASAGQRR